MNILELFSFRRFHSEGALTGLGIAKEFTFEVFEEPTTGKIRMAFTLHQSIAEYAIQRVCQPEAAPEGEDGIVVGIAGAPAPPRRGRVEPHRLCIQLGTSN